MKKLFAWLLVLVMLLSLAACGSEDNQPTKGDEGTTVGGTQGDTTGNNDTVGGTQGDTAGNDDTVGGKDEDAGSDSTNDATGADYTAAVAELVQVNYNGKADNLEAMAPEAFWTFYETNYQMPRGSMLNEVKYAVGAYKENYGYTYGAGYTVSHTIAEAKEITGDMLTAITAAFAQQKGINKIDGAYDLLITVNFAGSTNGVEDYPTGVAKIDGSWYFFQYNVWDEGAYVTLYPETMVGG